MLGPHSKKQFRAFGLVSTLGIGFWLSVGVGYYGGRWLDGAALKHLGWHTEPFLKWFGLAIGLAAAVREVIRGIRYVRSEMKKPVEAEDSDDNPRSDRTAN
jgi:hypothetical protein